MALQQSRRIPVSHKGIANPDFELALKTFMENPGYFSPALAIRSWVNLLSEPDVKFNFPEETGEDEEERDVSTRR